MEHFFLIITLLFFIFRFIARKEEPKEPPKKPLPPKPQEEPSIQRCTPQKTAAPKLEQKTRAALPSKTSSRSSLLRKLLREDGKSWVILSEVLRKKFPE